MKHIIRDDERTEEMNQIRILALVLLTGAAVLDDLYRGKISNGIIVTGLLWGAVYQVLTRGILGIPCFLGGFLMPLLLLSGLYYFRMIGAGDMKLLAVIGGFLGPIDGFNCMVVSVFLGGLISLVIMIRHHNFGHRMFCLAEYVSDYSRNKEWKPYLKEVGAEGRFCFSVPVFLAVLWCVMG